jgi:hypothetical protein
MLHTEHFPDPANSIANSMHKRKYLRWVALPIATICCLLLRGWCLLLRRAICCITSISTIASLMRSISLVPLLWLNWWSWLLWRGLLPCLRLLLLGITSLLTIRSSTPLCLAISINRWASQGRSSSHCHIWLVHFCTICESALRRWPLLGLHSGPTRREKLPMSCLCLLNCLDISKEIDKLPTPLCTSYSFVLCSNSCTKETTHTPIQLKDTPNKCS